MRTLILITAAMLPFLGGCQQILSQSDIEGDLRTAISEGQSPEAIEALLLQAKDPEKAANSGIREIAELDYLPRHIDDYWHYYKPNPTSLTPSIEIMEVLNRYKITVYEVLVRHGGDLNQKNEQGRPIIRFSNFNQITPNLLRWLLENGYDPNLTYGEHAEGITALSHCLQAGQAMLRYDQKYEMVKMLLEHGANPNVDCFPEPAMHTLVIGHKDDPYLLEIAEMLIEAGYDISRKKNSGSTALELIIGQGPDDVAFLLLEHTEEINTKTRFGSPFIVLAANTNPKCVELLLSRGVDLNVNDRNGNTPLHAAARGRNAEIVSMLLEAGVSVNPLNNNKRTPLDRAMQTDSCRPDEIKPDKVISLLIQHGAKTAAQLQ